MTSFAAALAAGPLVLDGGLATRLEERGHDLSGALWSAALLRDNPDEVAAAHRDYFAAGAQVATTATYQATHAGLDRAGMTAAEADALLTHAVRLARSVASEFDGDRFVTASVGPYGAWLVDGSEYHGRYGLTVAELRRFHRRRLQVLIAAEPDVLAVETIPCLAEVEAIVAELDGASAAAWVSLTCSGGTLRSGEPLSEAVAMLGDVPEIVAVGVNCTAPEDIADLLPTLLGELPVLVYPNSGEQWDADARTWTGRPAPLAQSAAGWLAAGVRGVGGCCRIGPGAIGRLAELTR